MTGHQLRHITSSILVGITLTVGLVMIGLQLAGGHFLSVQTGSMVPVIRKGDLVVVNRVSPEQLNRGDVITFISPKNPSQTITHRVIQLPHAANGNTLITKGDANDLSDGPIATDKIVGKVGLHLPYLGYLLDFLHSWAGLLVLIYLPALVIIAAECRRLVAYYKSQLPYVLQGHEPVHEAPLAVHHYKRIVLGVSATMALAISMIIVGPVFAALQSTATLTGTSITTAPGTTTPPNNGGGSTTTTTTNTTCTTTNNNTVNTTNNNPQTATTGNVNQNQNSLSGSASSGNASNTSTSNTTITIVNTGCSPTAAP